MEIGSPIGQAKSSQSLKDRIAITALSFRVSYAENKKNITKPRHRFCRYLSPDTNLLLLPLKMFTHTHIANIIRHLPSTKLHTKDDKMQKKIILNEKQLKQKNNTNVYIHNEQVKLP